MLAIMGRFGRLGNQLFTYSNVLAFAMDKKIECVNPTFSYSDMFCGTSKSYSGDRYVPDLVKSGRVIHAQTRLLYKVNLRLKYYPFIQLGEGNLIDLDADPKIVTYFLKANIVFLSGFYFRASKSLERNKDRVKKFFLPIPSLHKKYSDLVGRLRERADIVVGVHIRHGDYRTHCNGIMYYSIQEYVDIMRVLCDQNQNQKIVFLICSEEKHDFDEFDDLSVYQANECAVVEMYALSYCDYIFGPNSSFSQWASFYGDVPLHVLDWKTAESHKNTPPIYDPVFEKDFYQFTPNRFGEYSRKQVCITDFFG